MEYEKIICERCKCEYEIIPKVWVGKKLCKKCQTEELERFDNGWGNIIRVGLMALLVIFVLSLILPSSCSRSDGPAPADIYYRK